MDKELKEILTNYKHVPWFNDKELLFALCQMLYDKDILNDLELDRLYDRVQKLQPTPPL